MVDTFSQNSRSYTDNQSTKKVDKITSSIENHANLDITQVLKSVGQLELEMENLKKKLVKEG